MMSGMMWYDADPAKGLKTKIAEAAAYFEKKYGRKADVCMVNAAMAQPSPAFGLEDGRSIALKAVRYVLPGNLWIGVEVRDV